MKKRTEIQQLYAQLNTWIDAGIGDDILSIRPEYKQFVEEQREKGVAEEDIPQQVLWALREKLKSMPMEFVPEESPVAQQAAIPDVVEPIVITVGKVTIKVEVSK